MNIKKYLEIAQVPQDLHEEACNILSKAQKQSKGLTLAKWRVRIFKAKEISKLLEWEDERLCIKHPALADWDIAPMSNITASGDHFPWVETPMGGRPNPEAWADKDPLSADYQDAINNPTSQRYFHGNHPRSSAAREMWYRRNAGEYKAWALGQPVDITARIQRWSGESQGIYVQVVRCGNAWIINSTRKIIAGLHLKGRYGYEVDNIFTVNGEQAWYPIAGYELKAPVTWSTTVKIIKD